MHFSHLRLLIKKLVTKRLTTIGTSPYPILLLGLIPEFNTEALISIKAPHGHCYCPGWYLYGDIVKKLLLAAQGLFSASVDFLPTEKKETINLRLWESTLVAKMRHSWVLYIHRHYWQSALHWLQLNCTQVEKIELPLLRVLLKSIYRVRNGQRRIQNGGRK